MIERKRLPERSLVATYASMIAGESGDALRVITKDLSPELNFGFGADLGRFPGLTSEGIRSYAEVIFGVSIPPLEQSCINGFFDLDEWCSFYNIAISGTPFSQIKVGEERSKEILSEGHLHHLREVAKSDKTLATLFDENRITFMPNILGRILLNSRMLPVIRQDIRPFYIPNAKLLVAP